MCGSQTTGTRTVPEAASVENILLAGLPCLATKEAKEEGKPKKGCLNPNGDFACDIYYITELGIGAENIPMLHPHTSAHS